MNIRTIQLTIYGLCLTVLLGLMNCHPEYLNQQELNAFLQETSNGLSKEKEQGDIKVKVTYRPTDLLVAQELGKDYDVEKATALQGKYGAYAYFMVNMEVGGQDALYGTSTGQSDFSSKLQALSFAMADYVNLTTSSQDTIPVADYAFPRTFGLSKSTNLMFVFSKEKMQGKEWISFNLNEFGLKSGDQRFRFKLSDLENIPKLKL